MRVRVVDVVLPRGGAGGGGWDKNNDKKKKERAPRPVARWERVRFTVVAFDSMTPHKHEILLVRQKSWAPFGRAHENNCFANSLSSILFLVLEKRRLKRDEHRNDS